MKPDSPYLTLKEAAEYVRLAPQTLYNRRKELPDRLPGAGRKLIFRRSDLDEWLAKKRRPYRSR